MPNTSAGTFLPLEALASSGKDYGTSSRDTSVLQPLTGGGYMVYIVTGAGVLPSITSTFTMSVGGTFSGAPALPRVVALPQSWLGHSGAATLPGLTGAAAGTVLGFSSGAADLPMLEGAATGEGGGGWDGAARLPSISAEGRMGFAAAGLLPRLSAAGSATAREWGAGAGVLSLLAGSGNIVVGGFFTGAGVVPLLAAGEWWRVGAVLPMLTGTSSWPLLTGFEGWAYNLRTKAVTRFTNYPFTEFITVGSQVFAIGADGLYLLGGDSDAGAPIAWSIETGLSDMGRPGLKHIPYLYIDGIIDGEVEITIIDDRSREFVYQYDTSLRGVSHMKHRRKLGNGIRSTNFAIRVGSPTGAYVELNALEPEVTVTQRSA